LALLYRRVKLEPDTWDDLQFLAAQAAAGGTTVSLAASAVIPVFGAGIVLSGLTLIGGVVAGAGAFLGGILALTNDNSDEMTIGRETALASALYCVLTRRETTEITADVLREWISWIADAGFPAADLDIILGLLAWAPISYWRNEASVAPPKINPCDGATCPNRDIAFTYEFTGEAVAGAMQFIKPLAASMMTLLSGERNGSGIAATPGPNNTRSFHVTVYLGRIVPIDAIDLELAYNQTAAVTSPVLTLSAGGNVLATRTITGVKSGFSSIQYRGGGISIDRFTVSGIIGTDGDFDAVAYLELFYMKVCGDGWPTWGQDVISAAGCPEPTCAELDTDGYLHVIDFCFRDSDYSMNLADLNEVDPVWVSGEGFKSGWRSASAIGWRETTIVWPRTWANQTLSDMKIRVEYTLNLGETFGNTADYLILTTSGGIVDQIHLDRAAANAAQTVLMTAPANRNLGPGAMQLMIRSGQKLGPADPGGDAIIHRVTFYHNEAIPPYEILPEDL
jgi:hypothetical protein